MQSSDCLSWWPSSLALKEEVFYTNATLMIAHTSIGRIKRTKRTSSFFLPVPACAYLSSRHAFPAHPPEALDWLCGRRCCPSGSSGPPGKGICSQCPGSWQGRDVQMEAACHLESAGIRQQPAEPRPWQFCPLGGWNGKTEASDLVAQHTRKPLFLLLPQRHALYLLSPHISGTSLFLLSSANWTVFSSASLENNVPEGS